MAKTKIFHRINTSTVFGRYQTEDFFPIGIIVESQNKTIEIPSRIYDHLRCYRSDLERITKGDKELYDLLCTGYFSAAMLENLIKEKKFPVYNLLEDEKFIIGQILEMKENKTVEIITSEQLDKKFEQYTLVISDVFDKHIKKEYLKELRELFIYTAEKIDEKVLFRLTDYLIHFVNWDNTFYNYYDTSFDIMPGHLRKVENHLSAALRNKIKAYMAFHDNINTLKRFLEKRELGKISTLSVIDWKIDIKQILSNQFASVFGNKKATEYIRALDEIIDSALEQ